MGRIFKRFRQKYMKHQKQKKQAGYFGLTWLFLIPNPESANSGLDCKLVGSLASNYFPKNFTLQSKIQWSAGGVM
jgi:hypothetical protein